MKLAVRHRWDVEVGEARQIQAELRPRWVGSDNWEEIRTVAGLDAAFVLTASQAFRANRNRWRALREANQAIAGAVLYKYPEMEEIERAHARVRLQFPYVPGFLSFREIPALLAALRNLTVVPDMLFSHG